MQMMSWIKTFEEFYEAIDYLLKVIEMNNLLNSLVLKYHILIWLIHLYILLYYEHDIVLLLYEEIKIWSIVSFDLNIFILTNIVKFLNIHDNNLIDIKVWYIHTIYFHEGLLSYHIIRMIVKSWNKLKMYLIYVNGTSHSRKI